MFHSFTALDGKSAVVDTNGGGNTYVNAFLRKPRNKDVHPVSGTRSSRLKVLTISCTYGVTSPPPGQSASSTSDCATLGKEDSICTVYVRGSLRGMGLMVCHWKHCVNGNCVLVHGGEGQSRVIPSVRYVTALHSEWEDKSELRKATTYFAASFSSLAVECVDSACLSAA